MTAATCLLALAAVLATSPAPKRKASVPVQLETLPEPEYLSPIASEFLHRRMLSHGQDMVEIVMAATLLRRDIVRGAAERISREPQLSRPMPDAIDELNSSLPPRFFALQDELKTRARELALRAAEPKGNLGPPLSRLMETCISCHSTYLDPVRDESTQNSK